MTPHKIHPCQPYAARGSAPLRRALDAARLHQPAASRSSSSTVPRLPEWRIYVRAPPSSRVSIATVRCHCPADRRVRRRRDGAANGYHSPAPSRPTSRGGVIAEIGGARAGPRTHRTDLAAASARVTPPSCTMRVTEQIDALESLGRSPTRTCCCACLAGLTSSSPRW